MRVIFWLLILWAGTVLAQNKTLVTAKLPVGTEKRAAVIVANQDYADPRYDLHKTHNDADDMKATLEGMGFEVVLYKKDLSRPSFYREINQLREKLKGYQMVFFYYSGHGAEYEGQNYLIPTDIDLEYTGDIRANGVDMKLVYEVFGEARVKTSIVALDACRSLPIGKGGLPTGLSIPRDNPAGTFTMYATEAGRVAKENRNGRNSYFTQELIKHLPVPNLDINQIHYNTRQAVKAATNEEQAPDVADKLDNKLVLLQKDILDPEKEAMRAEIERLKTEREAALKNTTTPPDNTRVPTTVQPTMKDNSLTGGKGAKFLDLPFADMIFVKGGTFEMGSNNGNSNEKPAHTVTVSSFWIGKYEVTVEQYLSFCNETGNHWPEWMEKDSDYNINVGKYKESYYGSLKGTVNAPHSPIVGISYNEALEFCQWVSNKTNRLYRLPTEAEWEYAASGGQLKLIQSSNETSTEKEVSTLLYGGEEVRPDTHISKAYSGKLSKVGTSHPNLLGIYDMRGNVSEWCRDFYSEDWYVQVQSKILNPENVNHGNKVKRVLRGHVYKYSSDISVITFRDADYPTSRSHGIGFRLISPSQ